MIRREQDSEASNLPKQHHESEETGGFSLFALLNLLIRHLSFFSSFSLLDQDFRLLFQESELDLVRP